MRKVSLIIEILSEQYSFAPDKEQIAVWWKVGGYYPYEVKESSVDTLEIKNIVANVIRDNSNGKNLELSATMVEEMQNSAIAMCKDFADPNLTKCPVRYIEMLIRDKLTQAK